MKSINSSKIMIIQETKITDKTVPKLPNKGILVLDLTQNLVLFKK